ncbi:hypothetical protein M413DRAFT_446394 [Hebeloma cylindrosporum]|uniref:Arrestin-like N-terminal domain-containing protein n=1 Tax=Hebeloma cylindrosporum TaxID=76867 RepID=A0A0C2YGK7_HEBCY|nr:hypothetical protein M413DRAFT_446394 [Hebeloma cylindrosporum h7]
MTTVTAILPSYSREPSSSVLPPCYSSQPHADEETVAYTPRVANPTPHGLFIREWPQATLVLEGQDEGSRQPTYGRAGRIIGELGVVNPEKVAKVTVKLNGQMSLSVADSGSVGFTLVAQTSVLWKHQLLEHVNRHDGSAVEQRCPSVLPIQFQFPSFYQAEGKDWRLPPSFEGTFLGIPAMFIRCIYTLEVTITRTRTYHLASWTTNKTYITMLNFRPRTRPQRPIVLLGSVLGSIKLVPEEWLQVVTTMLVRPKSNMKPVNCHLFIPSIQTFALTDTIPFHLQLCSTLQSLQELLPPTSRLLKLPNGDDERKVNDRWEEGGQTIRVTITRQVVVEIAGRRRFRTFLVGMGNMWSVPPIAHQDNNNSRDGVTSWADSKEDGVCLDWQGEVKVWAELTTGGFSASHLLVKV